MGMLPKNSPIVTGQYCSFRDYNEFNSLCQGNFSPAFGLYHTDCHKFQASITYVARPHEEEKRC
jgi:hypothetical protein